MSSRVKLTLIVGTLVVGTILVLRYPLEDKPAQEAGHPVANSDSKDRVVEIYSDPDVDSYTDGAKTKEKSTGSFSLGSDVTTLLTNPDFGSEHYLSALSDATELLEIRRPVVRYRMLQLESAAVSAFFDAAMEAKGTLSEYPLPFFDDVTCTINGVRQFRKNADGQGWVLRATCNEYRRIDVFFDDSGQSMGASLRLNYAHYHVISAGPGFVLITETTPSPRTEY